MAHHGPSWSMAPRWRPLSPPADPPSKRTTRWYSDASAPAATLSMSGLHGEALRPRGVPRDLQDIEISPSLYPNSLNIYYLYVYIYIYIYVTYIDAFYLSLSVWDPEIDSASSSLFCSLRRAARLVTDWRVLGWVAPSCASVPSNALRKNLSASMLRRTTLGKRPGAEHHPTLGDGYIYIYIYTYPYNYIFIYIW